MFTRIYFFIIITYYYFLFFFFLSKIKWLTKLRIKIIRYSIVTTWNLIFRRRKSIFVIIFAGFIHRPFKKIIPCSARTLLIFVHCNASWRRDFINKSCFDIYGTNYSRAIAAPPPVQRHINSVNTKYIINSEAHITSYLTSVTALHVMEQNYNVPTNA